MKAPKAVALPFVSPAPISAPIFSLTPPPLSMPDLPVTPRAPSRPPPLPPAALIAALQKGSRGRASPASDEATAPAPAPALAPASAERRQTTPPSLDPGFGYHKVFVADPSNTMRTTLGDALLVSGLAEDVVTVRDGGRLLMSFIRACKEKAAPDLVVLDVSLPLLDGKNVSILLRAVEDAYSMDPVHIVFFTAKPHDAAFGKLIAYLHNARHVPRAQSANPGNLAQALVDVLTPT